jgi:predicted DCC family thiol-disulfide oxidoreductase YuxK
MEIGYYSRLEGGDRIEFVDVSRADASTGGHLDRASALSRIHLRRADGALMSGAAAFVEVWRLLPRWRWAARLASLPGMLTLLEASYRGFLLVRPRISRLAGRWIERSGKR